MPAPLETFLHYVTSGHNVLSPEMLAHFGGPDLLAALQKYDPEARLTETQMAGENGGLGFRVDVDVSKLPQSKGGMAGFDLNPANLHDNIKNPDAVYDDPVYGKVTNSANFYQDADKLWTKLAPIAVSMLAPMAGAGLAGMGIGGTAGLTAAATGSGLGAATSAIPSWAVQIIKNSPSLAKQIANGADWKQVLLSQAMGPAAGATGIDPRIIKAGLTLAQLARRP